MPQNDNPKQLHPHTPTHTHTYTHTLTNRPTSPTHRHDVLELVRRDVALPVFVEDLEGVPQVLLLRGLPGETVHQLHELRELDETTA